MTLPVDKSNFPDALKEIQSGASVTETLAKYGIKLTTFKKWLKRSGLRYKNPRLREVPIQCLDDYLAGESELSIANRLNISRNVITRFLDSHGIKRRNQSEANTVRMRRLSTDERKSLVSKAHAARTGVQEREEVLIKKAISKELSTCHFGPGEDVLYQALCEGRADVRGEEALFAPPVRF